MKSSCPTYHDLKAWLDRELSAPRAADVERHVEMCDGCRRQAEDFRALSTRIGCALEPAPPSIDVARVREVAVLARRDADGAVRWLRRVAAVAAVLLLSSSLFNVLLPPDRPASPYSALPPDEESADATRATIDPEYSVVVEPVGSTIRTKE